MTLSRASAAIDPSAAEHDVTPQQITLAGSFTAPPPRQTGPLRDAA